MIVRSTLGFVCVAMLAVASPALSAKTTHAAPGQKEPPACAAIQFRAVPSGLADGEHDAGLYRSRFGKIEVKAAVKGGRAETYFVIVDGKKPKPLTGALPKSAEACAATKKLSAPAKATEPCTGEKFTVLVDRATKDRIVLLYGHAGRTATFCAAGVG